MSVKKEQTVARGTTILSAAKLFSRAIGFFYWPILTIIISNDGNGIYQKGYQVYTMLYLVTTSGIPIAIAKAISELRAVGRHKDAEAVFKISTVLVSTIGAVGFFVMFFFPTVFTNMLSAPEAKLTIMMLSPTVILAALAAVLRGYFQGNKNMVPTAKSEVIEQIFNAVFSVIFAYFWISKGVEWGSAGATVGTTLGAFVSLLFLVSVFQKNRKSAKEVARGIKRYYTNKSLLKRVIRYAIPISLGSLATNLGFFVDTINTTNRLIDSGFTSKEANAMFGVLSTQFQKLINIPLTISLALGLAIIPAIAALRAQKDYPMVKRKISEAFRFILLLTIPAAVGFAVLAQPIIDLVFPRNNQGANLLLIGSSALVFISIVQIQTSILQSLGKPYYPPVTLLIGIGVKLVVNYILIVNPDINIMGAVIGTIVAYMVAMVMNFRMIKKLSGWRIKRYLYLKPIIAALMMAGVTWISYQGIFKMVTHISGKHYITNAVATMVSIGLGGIVYGIIMLYIGGIKERDIDRLPRKFQGPLLKLVYKG